MRIVEAEKIKKAVSELCVKANVELRADVLQALKKALGAEKNRRAKEVLNVLIENARIAKNKRLSICQDTGIVVAFVDIGQEIKISGNLEQAILQGVRDGYHRGYFRKSVVADPLIRRNASDYAPPIIHYNVVRGDKIKITIVPKGFGCENVSQIKMLRPTDGVEEVKDFVLDVVKNAGPDACPPYAVGIGIGGTQEKAATLAKLALIQPLTKRNPKNIYAKLERELLQEINNLGIGPMGFGGKTTALGVKILSYPTHIAGLPVAVNISCHALRSASATI